MLIQQGAIFTIIITLPSTHFLSTFFSEFTPQISDFITLISTAMSPIFGAYLLSVQAKEHARYHTYERLAFNVKIFSNFYDSLRLSNVKLVIAVVSILIVSISTIISIDSTAQIFVLLVLESSLFISAIQIFISSDGMVKHHTKLTYQLAKSHVYLISAVIVTLIIGSIVYPSTSIIELLILASFLSLTLFITLPDPKFLENELFHKKRINNIYLEINASSKLYGKLVGIGEYLLLENKTGLCNIEWQNIKYIRFLNTAKLSKKSTKTKS